MKKNKSLIIILLIVVVGVIGLTLAYFTNTASVSNEFKSKKYGTTVTEEFISPDNWLPGTSTDKSLTVTNSGQVDEAVRISYTESWTSRSAKNNEEEGDLPLAQNGNTAALIHFTNTDDWTTVTENGTTYRYYNYKLAPSATTSELLDYVTFNPAITNNSNCTTREENGTKTITCNSTGTGYDDATYKLTFNIETIQYDKYKTAWGTNVNIASMKPMNARELALKSNPISVTNYTDGNVHEMYTFNHEATEQTPALTDYRYIGNDPYNYVYFNCDDLNNQNSETCEVWRIIGVFDVERPDPNDNTKTITERRMKLVRGSNFEQGMKFDKNNSDWDGNNNWEDSTLKEYLNVDYLSNLSISSQNMITETKYFLGGNNSASNSGSTENIYDWERGIEVFSDDRPLNWIGKIALLYASDQYMVYSKGVDDNCFNEPYYCRKTKYYNEGPDWNPIVTENYASPESGWIHSTNLQLQKSEVNVVDTWVLSMYNDYVEQFFIWSDGNIGNGSCWHDYAVRPTLYLSSQVNITDGDGSINNPYKLSL